MLQTCFAVFLLLGNFITGGKLLFVGLREGYNAISFTAYQDL